MVNWPIYPFFDDGGHEPTLSEVFEDWPTDGAIFKALSELTVDMPWKDYDPVILDTEYLANRSGSKFCSPIVKMYLDDDYHVSSAGTVVLAKILATKYLNNWNRLWNTNVVEYEPIHNYDMSEQRQRAKGASSAEVSAESESHTGTQSMAYGKKEEYESTVDDNSTYSRYGLNTVGDPKPSDNTVQSTETDGSTTLSGTDTNTRNLSDTASGSKNKVDAEEETETLRRYGNIGVTTTQQMLQSERNLWVYWNFFEEVFKNLDAELTLAVFDPCRV